MHDATCTQEGSYDEVVYCEICNEVLSSTQKIITALGHEYRYGVCLRCQEDDPNDGSSNGLEIILNTENNEYTINNIGECTDKNIIIPSGYNGKPITKIGENAFYGCTEIESIVIPHEITTIDEGAFYFCVGLKNVYYTGTTSEWCNINFASEYSNPLYYAHNLFIDNVLLEELIIPDDVIQINPYAFVACNSIKNITISNSVQSIGQSAFYGCINLETIIIPNSVKQIGSYAWDLCNNLNSIFYCGDSQSWNNIFYGGYQYSNFNVYFYAETQPSQVDKYWHYVDGKIVIW